MNWFECKNNWQQKLTIIYDKEEAEYIFFITIDELFNLSKKDYILQSNQLVEQTHLLDIDNVLQQLLKNKPIQYIIGKAHFYGYDFEVTEHTLIPRRETEELVNWVLEVLNNNPNKKWKILDIGTGTGCIPITIKKEFTNAVVTSLDISEKAIEVAKKNATNLNTEVTFIKKNILKTTELDTFDIIISNPPYVRELEKKEINPNVLNFEPHTALFVTDEDPLVFYKKITKLAKKHLAVDGKLFFEINQYLANETVEMVGNYFSKTELKKDMQQNFRMLKASN